MTPENKVRYKQMLQEAEKEGSGCSESYKDHLKQVISEKSKVFEIHSPDYLSSSEDYFSELHKKLAEQNERLESIRGTIYKYIDFYATQTKTDIPEEVFDDLRWLFNKAR